MTSVIARRAFLVGTGAVLLAAPFAAVTAQPREKVPRVGYLNPGSASDPLRQRRLDAFRQGLRELCYVEGQNIAIESRWADGQYDRYPALAADLVRSKVNVIVAQSGAATQAAQQATRTIPIVMSLVLDPVGIGLVPSLARPGGERHGDLVHGPRPGREAVGTAQGGGSQGLSGGPPSASGQSGERSQLARGGGCSSGLGGAASNPGGAEPPGDRQRLRGDDQGAGGRAPDSRGRLIRESAKTDRRARDEEAPAIDIFDDGVRGGRRSHGLWPKPS